jgi:hypothetical protein
VFTGSTAPDRPARRADRLKGLLDEFEADEAGEARPAAGNA